MFWRFMSRAILGRVDHGANPTSVYDALHENPHLRFDADRPYWNYGLWIEGTESIGDACEALCEEVAQIAELGPDDVALDVGCGEGPQLEHWRARSLSTLVAVDRCLAHARSCSKIEGIDVLVADGAILPFMSGSFDTILCVEAAFHFDTRADFIREAYRLLRTSGRLVTTDLVATREDPRRAERLWWWAFSRVFYVPKANRISAAALLGQLTSAGFDATVTVRTDEVVVPFLEEAGRSLGRPLARRACAALARVFRDSPPFEYVFVVARKKDRPSEPT